MTVAVGSMSRDKHNVSVMIDGHSRTVGSKQPVSLSSCVEMTWTPAHLTLTVGSDHLMIVTWASDHSTHINTTYLNIQFDVPLEDSRVCGGVIGQTASRNLTKPSTDAKLFMTHDLLSTDAKTNKFAAHHIPCTGTVTQPLTSDTTRFKKTATSSASSSVVATRAL